MDPGNLGSRVTVGVSRLLWTPICRIAVYGRCLAERSSRFSVGVGLLLLRKIAVLCSALADCSSHLLVGAGLLMSAVIC